MIWGSVDPKSSIFKTLKRFENLHLEALHKRMAGIAERGVRYNYFTAWGNKPGVTQNRYAVYLTIKSMWIDAAGGPNTTFSRGFLTGSTFGAIKGAGTPEAAVVGLEGKWPSYSAPKVELSMLEVLRNTEGFYENWVNKYYKGEEERSGSRKKWGKKAVLEAQRKEIAGDPNLAFIDRFGEGVVTVTVGRSGMSIKWPFDVNSDLPPVGFTDRIYPPEDFATKKFMEGKWVEVPGKERLQWRSKYGARARGRKYAEKGLTVQSPKEFIRLPKEYVPTLFNVVDRHISILLGLPVPPVYRAPVAAPPPKATPPVGRGGAGAYSIRAGYPTTKLTPPSPIREIGQLPSKHWIKAHPKEWEAMKERLEAQFGKGYVSGIRRKQRMTSLRGKLGKYKGLESNFIDRLSAEQLRQYFKGTWRNRRFRKD